MGDAEVERAAQDRALAVERAVVAEVVPQPERDGGQLQAAAAAAAVGHPVVAVLGGDVGHDARTIAAGIRLPHAVRADTSSLTMVNARIDITRDLDGQPVVLACFDLAEADVAAAAHAVAAARTERYRNTEMSVDDVLAMRELTARRGRPGRPGAPPRRLHGRPAAGAADGLPRGAGGLRREPRRLRLGPRGRRGAPARRAPAAPPAGRALRRGAARGAHPRGVRPQAVGDRPRGGPAGGSGYASRR